MTKETLFSLLGGIDERYIREAGEECRAMGQPIWKRCFAAACFALILMTAGILIPRVLEEREPISTYATEALFESKYCYTIDAGRFSSYVGGKVIDEQNIGDQIGDVTVTAGWIDSNQTWSGMETLRAEVYAIIGVPPETAAALRFIDRGDAVTTTHYYVILNPTADLSAVEDYRIVPFIPHADRGEEGVIPE